MYHNPEDDEKNRTLRSVAAELSTEGPGNHLHLLGDFNLHHPPSSGVWTRRADRETRMGLNIIESSRLWQLTPVGPKTHRWFSNDTTIDLSFATQPTWEKLLQCNVAHELDCDSGHLPVSTWFSWSWKKATARRTRRWAATNVDKLRITVRTELVSMVGLNNADSGYKLCSDDAMKFSPSYGAYFNRDRFVLSNGKL